jgi:hypothetical protein
MKGVNGITSPKSSASNKSNGPGENKNDENGKRIRSS